MAVLNRPRISAPLTHALNAALPGGAANELIMLLNALVSPDAGAGFVVDSPIVGYTNIATVTAAGSNRGQATPLTAPMNVVSGANGTAGVIMPTPSVIGQEVIVLNTSPTGGLNVYGDQGATSMDGGAANTPAIVPALKAAIFRATALNPSAWWSLSN